MCSKFPGSVAKPGGAQAAAFFMAAHHNPHQPHLLKPEVRTALGWLQRPCPRKTGELPRRTGSCVLKSIHLWLSYSSFGSKKCGPPTGG